MITSRRILGNLFSWKWETIKVNLRRKYYNINFVNISVWKQLSLSEAEISHYNKKILYLAFCRLEKHLRFYIVSTKQDVIQKLKLKCPIFQEVDHQTMKFGQFIKDDMRIIFLEKPFTKCGWEASPRPFYKKSILSISLDQHSGTLWSLTRLRSSNIC